MNKKYSPLPDIKTIEGLLLVGEIMRKGFSYAKQPKITDNIYINMIKMVIEEDV